MSITKGSTFALSVSGNSHIDFTAQGYAWSGSNINYSFPTTTACYTTDGAYTGTSGEIVNFQPFSSTHQTQARRMFDELMTIIPITFTEITETSTDHADIRFGYCHDPSNLGASHTYIPFNGSQAGSHSGDVWIDTNYLSYSDAMIKGTYGWYTLVHETGHALGLRHDVNSGSLGGWLFTNHADIDACQNSIMYYKGYIGDPANNGANFNPASTSYMQGYMSFDIEALWYAYGKATNPDRTLFFNESTGAMVVNGVTEASVPIANKIFRPIWNNIGILTLDVSNYSNLNLDFDTLGVAPAIQAEVCWNTLTAGQVPVLNGGRTGPGSLSLVPGTTITGMKIGTGTNTIYGMAGVNNRIELTTGTDTVDGRSGTNTIVMPNSWSTYGFTGATTNSVTITGSDGTKSLTNIQFVQFSDVLRTVDGNIGNPLTAGRARSLRLRL